MFPGAPFFFGNIFFSESAKIISILPSKNLQVSITILSLKTTIPKITNFSVILKGVK